MEILIKIVQFILCFSLLVFVHEMGHFLFAKLFKIRVEKFYLFFNPGFSLFKFTWRGTEYGMGWIPFGGYVSISGMIDETKDSSKMASKPEPYEFRSKPTWQRLLVMIGGVLMNLITAIVIFIFMSYSQGSSYIKSSDVVGGYAFTKTAKELGFKDGDKILSINGEAQEDYRKYRELIIINSDPVICVERAGEIVEIRLTDADVPKLLDDQVVYNLRSPFFIDSIAVGGAIDRAGVMAGDSIISINGQKIEYLDQIHSVGSNNKSKEIKVIIQKALSNQIDTLDILLAEDGKLGIITIPDRMNARIANHYTVTKISYTFLESIPRGVIMTWEMCGSYINQLKMMFRPETGAYKEVGSILTMGSLFPSMWNWTYFWNITALFSVVLAIMNMLPIPALDGGHVLFLLIEVITRRKLSDKVMEKIQIFGFYLLVGIMVLALWNDIVKFFM